MKVAKETGSLPPPKSILNAPTTLMKEQGYSEGYIYDHDTENAFSGQNYFPDDMDREELYCPGSRGYETTIQERIWKWKQLRGTGNL